MANGLNRRAFNKSAYDYWGGQYGVVNVRDFGAVGDGVHDDTRAFNQALTGANKNIHVPPGKYNITSLLTVYSGTKLHGVSDGLKGVTKTSENNFAILYFSNTTAGIKLPTDTESVTGVSISGIVFLYPEQTSGTSPVVFPPAIQAPWGGTSYSLNKCSFKNLLFIGAYDGIALECIHGGIEVERISGWCWHDVLTLDQAVDIVFLDHFFLTFTIYTDFYGGIDSTLANWSYQNGHSLVLKYNDAVIGANLFLGAQKLNAMLFEPSALASPIVTAGWYQFANVQTDDNAIDIQCNNGMNFDSCQFSNCYFTPAASAAGGTTLSPEAVVKTIGTVSMSVPMVFSGCTFQQDTAAKSLELDSGLFQFCGGSFGSYGAAASTFGNVAYTELEFFNIRFNENNTWTLPAIRNFVMMGNFFVSETFVLPNPIPSSWMIGNASGGGKPNSLAGHTAGTIYWSESWGVTNKKVIIYLDGYENDSTTVDTISFQNQFTYTPLLNNAVAVAGVTVGLTDITLAPNNTTVYTGWIELTGF